MFNKIILMGRLVRDPETRRNANGSEVCKISIAVNRSYTNKQNGEKQEETDFFDVDFWGKTGETVGMHFQKGDMILIEGEMRNNNWTDNSGVKHYGMRVNASGFAFCGSKNAAGQQAPPQQYQQPQGYQQQQQPPQNYAPYPPQYQQAPPQQYQQPQGYQQYQGYPPA